MSSDREKRIKEIFAIKMASTPEIMVLSRPRKPRTMVFQFKCASVDCAADEIAVIKLVSITSPI